MMKKLGRFRRDSDEVTTALHTDEFVRSDDVTALESELTLLRRAVKQLGAERTILAALVVALDSDYTDMLSRETQTTFQNALDTAEPDADVLELIKEQHEPTD